MIFGRGFSLRHPASEVVFTAQVIRLGESEKVPEAGRAIGQDKWCMMVS